MLRYKTIESLIDLKIKEGSQVSHSCKPSLNSAFYGCYVLRDGASVKTNIGLFLEISKFMRVNYFFDLAKIGVVRELLAIYVALDVEPS